MSITPCRDPFGIGVFWAILCGQSMQNSFSRGSKPSFYWHLSVGEPKQRHLSEASTVSGFAPYQYIVGVWLDVMPLQKLLKITYFLCGDPAGVLSL